MPFAQQEAALVASLSLTDSPLQRVSLVFTLVVDSVLLVGNLLPLLVVWKVKRAAQRTNFDYAVSALSACDMLSVLVPQPAWLTAHLHTPDARLCHFHQVTQLWFQMTAMFLVVVLCLDRARTMRRLQLEPMPLPTDTRNPRSMLALTTLLLLLMLAVAVLPLLGYAPGGHPCVPWLARAQHSPIRWTESIFFLVFAAVCGLCLLSVLTVNLAIIGMWQRKQDSYKNMQGQEVVFGAASAQELLLENAHLAEMTCFIQSMRVVALISLAFSCTWIPTLVRSSTCT